MKKLFGTDGVRGKAGVDIDVFTSLKLAISMGIYYKKHSKTNKILVGKDTRKSGYMIENAIVAGLTSIGYNVVQIGPMPSPAIAFLTQNLRCDAGIMISASHNPYYDNGIKFFNNKGGKLNSDIEKEIEDIFFKEDFDKYMKQDKEIGRSKRIDDVIGRYIVNIKNSFPSSYTLTDYRIVLDTANGASYKVAPTIFEELDAEVITIHNNPNGFNINNNCGALNTSDLSKKVLESRADIGFAFDGDADRLVVVDENGEKIDGNNTIASIAYYLKSENKLHNNKIVSTTMSNGALDDFCKKHGIINLKSDIGDKNVTELMKKEDVCFGAEESGHIIFNEFTKTGDGTLSALQIMALIVKAKEKASKVLKKFELYPSKLVNFPIKKKIELSTIDGYKEMIKKLESAKVKHLIRYSGTEKLLRIFLETKNNKDLDRYIKEVEYFFKDKLN